MIICVASPNKALRQGLLAIQFKRSKIQYGQPYQLEQIFVKNFHMEIIVYRHVKIVQIVQIVQTLHRKNLVYFSLNWY